MAANPTDIRVPPECREMIRAGALVAISTSGGKDSQAAVHPACPDFWHRPVRLRP